MFYGNSALVMQITCIAYKVFSYIFLCKQLNTITKLKTLCI